jgi:hypothetical protein
MTTPQAFATPGDFLAHLRSVYGAPILGDSPDSDLLARTQTDIQAMRPGAGTTGATQDQVRRKLLWDRLLW